MAKRFIVLVCCLLGLSLATPLDDYVNAPDPSYKYTLAGTLTGEGAYPYTAFFINLTSQTWMSYEQSNKPVWTHWLTICVPPKVQYETSFLFIDGDHNSPNPPSEVDNLVSPICGRYNSIIAVLNQIPDEPITFVPETQGRTEDALIAFTWAKFLNNTNDPIWLARLPMTKAVVRAMDTVTDFLSTFSNIPPQNKFVIGGASKRGWTTWTTAAVDKRVVAAVPIVMPILNMVPNLNHHYQAYGEWSFALEDYENMGIMGYLNTPQFLAMGAVVDPYSYLSRLTMPLYIICATGDEFFLPDSPRFFTDALQGEYHLRLVPNAEHSLAGHGYDVISSIGNFFESVLLNEVRPKYSYEMVYSNDTASINVKLLDDNVPVIVKLWTSNTLSFIQRDFRLVVCDDIEHCLEPVLWWETVIEAQNGVYTASVTAPSHGWTGFMIELTYVINGNNMVFTSEVNIVPDRMPFPPCGDHCQP